MGNEAATCAIAPARTGYYTQEEGMDVMSIQKYFERPVIISSANLDVAPGNLYSYAFANTTSYINLFGANNWARLKGAVGVRGTLVFTLNVTASAFNQGILALAFQYGIGSLTSNDARHNYFPNVVNLPHVKLNVASTTMVQLEVPFVSQKEYIPVEVGEYSTVTAGIVSLTNLTGSKVAAGQDQARYTLYVSMKDMEIIGAYPFDVTTVTLQSGVPVRANTTVAHKDKGENVKGSSSVSKEAEQMGLISRPLRAIAGAAGALSAIPGLSTIGGATNWFTGILANTAESFGFSKPLDETLVTRMNRQSYAGDGQVDMPTNAFALTPFQGNKVGVDPSIGLNDENEMSLDYILTKYQYIYHGAFSTTTAVSDTIYGCPICPTAFWYRDVVLGLPTPLSNKPLKTSNTALENAFLPSTLCFVADNFRWWRGGFKFKFSFAKTKLHGGRIQATFIPFATNPPQNTPYASTTIIPATSGLGPVTTGYSYIFDLRDADEFEFEVPYINIEPYCSTYASIGDLSLTVVAPLKTNAAAPATVDFMVEVSALPGFEFATPAPSIMAGVPTTGFVAITYQSGLDLVGTKDDSSQDVVGERFTSVKQIIMQPDYFATDVANASIYLQHFDPWFKANAPALAVPMPTTAQALWFASRSSRFASLYAFARGGTMAIFQKEVGAQRVTASLVYAGNQGGASVASNGTFYNKALNLYSSAYIADSMESFRAKIPTYTNCARLYVQDSVGGYGGNSLSPGAGVWTSKVTNVVPVLRIRNSSGTSTRIVVGRAAADDAILARFVGPPACIVFNSLATVSPVFGAVPGSAF